jgi:type VI protein secretion system component Hcp
MNQQRTKDGRPANTTSVSDELFELTLAELVCVAGGTGHVQFSEISITKNVDVASARLF